MRSAVRFLILPVLVLALLCMPNQVNAAASGWQKVDGQWCYVETDGSRTIGWKSIGGSWYYFNSNGIMATGWRSIDGVYYYFKTDGAMKTGWLQDNGSWYYLLPSGAMAVGMVDVGTNTYAFTNDGRMLTGVIVEKPFSYLDVYKYYYADASGALQKGWKSIDGYWRYFYKDGHMAFDTYIDNFYIDSNGVWISTAQTNPLREYYADCTRAQATEADAIAKGIAKDALANGGDTDYDKVKYAANKVDGYIRQCDFNSETFGVQNTACGVFVAGVCSSKGRLLAMGRVLDFMDYTWYEAGGSARLKMDGEYGWVEPLNGKVGFGNYGEEPPYFYNPVANPPKNAAGSWKQLGGKWYFADSNGVLQKGWKHIGGQWYYLSQDGVMKTGWLKDNGKWYYLTTSGAMKTGWLKDGGKWYFLQADGAMATGSFRNLGQWYYADANGVMQTGWKQLGGKWYYFDSDGAMARGNAQVGGKTYLFDSNGVMQTGWLLLGDKWYYSDTNGITQKGWRNIGGKDYYFYKDGHMAQNAFIDNYFVGKSGAWESTVAVAPDHQHYKHLTSAQAQQADAVAQAIAQDAMANGGDTDLEKIRYAAKIVESYVDQCRYRNDANYYYRSPYGVFVAGVFTCAGSTRAMGRVLDYMGYTWYHPGEDQWDHQWVCVKMDGEYGWIEPQQGYCGYGNYMESYNPFN